MKKLMMIAAVAVSALNASAADGFKATKPLDNTYISLQGGVYEPLTGQNILKDARPVIRLSVNKYFNTVIGASLWAQTYVNNNNYNDSNDYPFYSRFSRNMRRGNKTMFDGLNVGINGLVNLNNLFAGYAGEPRFFEVVAEAGVGYFHQFGAQAWNPSTGLAETVTDWRLVSHSTINFALDFNFNLSKKLQLGIRPEIQYLENVTHWNSKEAQVQLTAGVAYNLGDVFTPIVPRSQEEIDGLNGQINSLKGQLADKDRLIAAKNKDIENLKNRPVEKSVECQATGVINVFFAIGKDTFADPKDIVNLDNMCDAAVKNKLTVLLTGAADSATGSVEINQKLAEGRVKRVKDYMISKGVPAENIKTIALGGVDTLTPPHLNRRVLVQLQGCE